MKINGNKRKIIKIMKINENLQKLTKIKWK